MRSSQRRAGARCAVPASGAAALPVLGDGRVGLGGAVELDSVILEDRLRLHRQVHQGWVCKETATSP